MLVENIEDRPQGSDIQGLSADLLEAARRRNISGNSLAAYERTWTRFIKVPTPAETGSCLPSWRLNDLRHAMELHELFESDWQSKDFRLVRFVSAAAAPVAPKTRLCSRPTT